MMKGRARRHFTSFVLLAVAVGLGVYFYGIDRGSITARERAERVRNVFPAFRRAEITGFDVARANTGGADVGAPVVVERRQNERSSWSVTTPRAESADDATVDSWISALEFATFLRRVRSDSIAFGKPRLRGALRMGRVAYKFSLGAEAPSPDGAAYFDVESEGTFVISKETVANLLIEPDMLRQRTLIPYALSSIQRIEIHLDASTLSLQRSDMGTLRESGHRVDRVREESIFSALGNLRFESFLKESPAGNNNLVLSVFDSANERSEIRFGGACPEHAESISVERVSPSLAYGCVPKAVADTLNVAGDGILDKHLFYAHADEVEELTLQALPSGPTVDLARKESGWRDRIQSKDIMKGDADSIDALVARVVEIRATSIQPAEPSPAFEPAFRVMIRRAGDHREEVVELDKPLGGEPTNALRRDDASWLKVESDDAYSLRPHPDLLRSSILFEGFSKDHVAIIRTRCNGVEQQISRDSHGFTMRTPRGFDIDNTATLKLIDTLTSAKADAWVARVSDGFVWTEGTNNDCWVEVTPSPETRGTRAARLTFGKGVDGRVYARYRDDDAVATVSRDLRDTIRMLPIRRTAFVVDPATTSEITLTHKEKTFRLVKSEGHFQSSDLSGVDAVEHVTAAVFAVYPEGALHIGPPSPTEGFGAPSLTLRIASNEGGRAQKRTIEFGNTETTFARPMVYARVTGVSATFLVKRDLVDHLRNAL